MISSCGRVVPLSIMNDQELAKNILEITPRIIRFIRSEMRSHAKDELSVPQFRVLMKLAREPNCTHQDVAEWMGITAPTLTRMIDTLEKRKLVKRVKDKNDLRRTTLSATPLGEKLRIESRSDVQIQLQEKMKDLSSEDKEKVAAGYAVLARLFTENKPEPK